MDIIITIKGRRSVYSLDYLDAVGLRRWLNTKLLTDESELEPNKEIVRKLIDCLTKEIEYSES